MTHTEESLMALIQGYKRGSTRFDYLRLAIREVLAERDKLNATVDAVIAEQEKAIARAESAEAECERLRKDAERYRWLRGSADVPSHSVRWGRWEINHWEGANGWRNLLCSELDAAIDAAMQEKQP